MDRDLPGQNLRRGDTILTYSYRGEGFSAVWFKGKYQTEFDISFAKRLDGTGCGGDHCAATYIDMGQHDWWAQVKLPSGQTGWVSMETAEFDGTNLLAAANFTEPKRSASTPAARFDLRSKGASRRSA